mgnify:FL=1
MGNQISLEQIDEFKKIYNSEKTNKIIENAITKNGLENACINRDIIIENQPIFNIELPESKRYDQKDSWRCWIFGGLNLIKHNIAKNLNMNVIDLELSNNHIAFYDKLEKSNNTYENIIDANNVDFEYIHKDETLKFCVSEGGYWDMFVSIVNKYGIVPYSYNPDTVESTTVQNVEYLYTEKIKKDILKLIELKKNGMDINVLRIEKKKFLQENYILLCKIYGEPTTKFNFEYKDKDGNYKKIENLTPIDFKNRFLNLKLEDFVTIGNTPMYNKEYYKLYQKKHLGNVYGKSYVKYLNLPIEDLKELSIKQLKDNVPVYMGAHILKFRDKKSGVLDIRLYNYEDTLNLKRLSKEEALNLYDISMHHIMSFTGVNLVNGKPQRWKVEDSYGDKEKVNGYYIMNDNFFNEFVLSVVIDKKYLSEKQLKLLEQEPIKFAVEDTF